MRSNQKKTEYFFMEKRTQNCFSVAFLRQLLAQ
jgi:hypothetical protein